MIATTWWQMVLAGMAGPLLVELAKVIKWHSPRLIFLRWKREWYWLPPLAFAVLGGALGWLVYGGERAGVSVVRIVHLGATAPLIVASWASGKDAPTGTSANLVSSADADPQALSPGMRLKDLVRW